MTDTAIGTHLRHACDGDDCIICRNRLTACRTCLGVEAELPLCCPGRPLTAAEREAVADRRMEVIADDRGVRIYAIDEHGIAYRDWDGRREDLTWIMKDGDEVMHLAAAPADRGRQLTTGIDDPVAITFNSGVVSERRRGWWHQVPVHHPLCCQYSQDGTLWLATEAGARIWDGRSLSESAPSQAPAAAAMVAAAP